ncbi:hypothetical protein ABW19_dt0207271 [Dactylella cylindrospora]|nr:hypothetical protein ABW19_dt0207271 [Dactylella cylindrospora]
MAMAATASATRLKPPLNLDDEDDAFSKLASRSRSKPSASKLTPSKPPPKPVSKSAPPTTTASPSNTATAEDEEGEDDYMSMAVADPTAQETSLQRLKRRKMEAAARGRPLSKAAMAEQERLKRDIGLSTSLMTSNSGSKGLKMMKAMGYTAGDALGKAPSVSAETTPETNQTTKDARTLEPLRPVVRESRTGIGHESELKRKFSDYTEATAPSSAEQSGTKRQELSPESYRNRLTLEAQQRRHEAQLFAAQSICEKLVAEDPPESYDGDKAPENGDAGTSGEQKSTKGGFFSGNPTFTQIKQINLIYRGLLYRRALSQLKARLRKDFESNGPTRSYINNPILPTYNRDGEFEEDDRIAMQTSKDVNAEESMLEEEWEDQELEEFEKREIKDRLDEIVRFLRTQWKYCFWCKWRYASDEELDKECPGEREEDHD